jgi:hypothetical protein
MEPGSATISAALPAVRRYNSENAGIVSCHPSRAVFRLLFCSRFENERKTGLNASVFSANID